MNTKNSAVYKQEKILNIGLGLKGKENSNRNIKSKNNLLNAPK